MFGRQAPTSKRGGPPADGFDFTYHMRRLCEDLTSRLPELAHIDMERVAVGFSQTRKPGPYGTHASLTPMRFAGGELVEWRRGRWYTVQRLFHHETRIELLYILNFYLPRFMDTPFHDKLVTVLHELWHISPRFDGDLRRHEGRCYAHTGSQKNYDAHMARLADRWLELNPPTSVYAFLKYDFRDLRRIYGCVYGTKSVRPKLLPISEQQAQEIRATQLTDLRSDP